MEPLIILALTLAAFAFIGWCGYVVGARVERARALKHGGGGAGGSGVVLRTGPGQLIVTYSDGYGGGGGGGFNGRFSPPLTTPPRDPD